MLKIIPYSSSLYVERKGNTFVNPVGEVILTIESPFHFSNVEEGMALTLAIRQRSEASRLDYEINAMSDRIQGLEQERQRLKEQRDIAAAAER